MANCENSKIAVKSLFQLNKIPESFSKLLALFLMDSAFASLLMLILYTISAKDKSLAILPLL